MRDRTASIGNLTGVIVCGGRGRRLGPLADVLNKSLFPLQDGPIVISVVRAMLDAFDCQRIVFLTGHLAWQVEQVVRAYAPSVEMEFMPDNSARGTADAVCNAVSILGLERFAYAHGNVALGTFAVSRLREAAQGLCEGVSLLAVSEVEIAPTHPVVKMAPSSIEPPWLGSDPASVFSVGFGLFQGIEQRTIESERPSGCTLEDHIFAADSGDHPVRAVNIGADWRHLEDLDFYSGVGRFLPSSAVVGPEAM